MTNASTSNSHFQQISPEEQKLYDYFSDAVHTISPEVLLLEFQDFLIEGKNSPNPELHQAFNLILKSQKKHKTFNNFMARCCHILIHHWHSQSQAQQEIFKLIHIFDSWSTGRVSASLHSGRLQKLLQDFLQSDQYIVLKRLANAIEQAAQTTPIDYDSDITIERLIYRYPFLYQYCLLNEYSHPEHQATVQRLQQDIQQSFELNLSRYVSHKVRLALLAQRTNSIRRARKTLVEVDNPTLLSESELGLALKTFVGMAEQGKSYQMLAHQFSQDVAELATYEELKDQLFDYIIHAINRKYSDFQFGERLHAKLRDTLPEFNAQKPNELLLVRTITQLCNFLVVESPQQLEHYVFIDMQTNLGSIATIALLLKLMLVCGKVKPHLEKRFAILFKHYETQSLQEVPWFVHALENMQLAWSIHFGNADVSFLKHIM